MGKVGETGSWCVFCGKKVLAVETRLCGKCKYHKRLFDGSICTKFHMSVVPDMFVTYKIFDGTCFES